MSVTRGPRPATRDHLLSQKKPLSEVETVVLDDSAAVDRNKARAELWDLDLRLARFKDADRDSELYARLLLDKAALEERVTDAEQRLADASVTLRIVGMSRTAFDRLVNEHPPTEEQQAEADAELEEGQKGTPLPYNGDTFVPALLAATCHLEGDERLTEDEWRHLVDDEDSAWNGTEISQLFATAMNVCNGRRIAQLGKG